MGQNLDLEIKVIKRFINKSKQDRYIQFVNSLKNQPKLILLPHLRIAGPASHTLF